MLDANLGAAIGIGLNVLGAVLAATAFVIQKTTHMRDMEKPEEERVGMMLRPMWWVGVGCMIISALFEAWSLSFTSLAVVSPLSGLTVVFNLCLSVYFLGEKTNRWEIGAVFIIMAGIGCTSAFGPRSSEDYKTHQIEHMWQGCQFNSENKGPIPDGDHIAWYNTNDCHASIIIIYFCCVGLLWAANIYGMAFMFHWPRLNALSFASFASSLGAQQQLFLKCAVELLASTWNGDNQLDQYAFWLYITVVCILSPMQMYFLNKGLSYHDSIRYIPLYQALLVVYATTAGGVFFDEFGKFDLLAGIMFGLGITLVAVGLLMFGSSSGALKEEGGEEMLKDGTDGDCKIELSPMSKDRHEEGSSSVGVAYVHMNSDSPRTPFTPNTPNPDKKSNMDDLQKTDLQALPSQSKLQMCQATADLKRVPPVIAAEVTPAEAAELDEVSLGHVGIQVTEVADKD